MDNIKMSVKDDTLTITVDLTLSSGPSKSGKTLIIATTRGFLPVPEHKGIAISLNVNKQHK